MSVYIDHIKNDKDLPITYSINIKTLSTSKRPLTCCITTAPRISKQRVNTQLNYLKPSSYLEKTDDFRLKSSQNDHRSSIHLPVTYSTSIHVPCHPPPITPRPPIILPSLSSHHHYHHYHHYYHHHHHSHHRRQTLSSQPSTTIKYKTSPQLTSTDSTRPTTTSTTTLTSPESLLQSKKSTKNTNLSLPIPTSNSPDKQSSHHPTLLPSYSALVWNWFHHIPTKSRTNHKGSQSDYSEVYRHESPSKRNLLFKLITSPIEKKSKTKHHHTCFTRKRLESSSSLPNKFNNYNE